MPALLFPSGVTPVVGVGPHDTVDQAQPLGNLSITPEAGARGTIGGGVAASADVVWYHFTLDAPATVDLEVGVGEPDDPFRGVISLYNEDAFDFGDALDPLGHRLMAQDEAAIPGGFAHLTASLGPGSYDVAVSGAGNRYFNPLMAGSGYGGTTGDYNLVVSASPLDLAPGSGPIVLASDPAPGASIDSSPLAIRLELSAPIDPSTVAAGSTVRLIFDPPGISGVGSQTDVALASVNYSAAAGELQLFPRVALRPGHYRVILAGDAVADAATLAAPDGTPIGADLAHPRGRDLAVSFNVTGIEGGSAADDTLTTAYDLGDVTGAGLVQVAGAIGADPYYDPSSPDPALNPGNDVNFYRLHVGGEGPYALVAEVFAGRIGSPLDAGVALYRVDPSDGTLHFLAGDNNSQDAAPATDGSNPLLLDPVLYSSLTAGDYVVAVSSGSNTPAPSEGQAPGSTGLYDPKVSHSGQSGFSTGPYVLNLRVEAVPEPPAVVDTSPAQGSILTAPPTRLTVRFSEPVDLQQTAYQAYQQTSQSSIASVYVLGSDGTKYFPRLESFDRATNLATFLMLDALPNGSYGLHLSGPGGLTDLAGTPLVADDPGGDFVVGFRVRGSTRGTGTEPLTFQAVVPTGADDAPQDLGVLFPHELQAKVTVTRSPSASATDAEDSYRFEVLQTQTYVFNAQGSDALPSFPLWLTDDKGAAVGFATQGDATQSQIAAALAPGVYEIHVGRWTTEQAAGLSYVLTLDLQAVGDDPPPLLVGPAPALQFRLSALPSPSLSDKPASPSSSDPSTPSTAPSEPVSSGTSQSPSTAPSEPVSSVPSQSPSTAPSQSVSSAPSQSVSSSPSESSSTSAQGPAGGASGSSSGTASTPAPPALTQNAIIGVGSSTTSPSTSPGGPAPGVVGNSTSVAPTPSHDSGGLGHADPSTGSSGQPTSPSSSAFLAPGVSGSIGLVTLGVGPIGGPPSAGGAGGASALQIAFALPSESRTLSPLKGLLALLSTAPLLPGDGGGDKPIVAVPELPGEAAAGLFPYFDEALRQVSEAGPARSLEVVSTAAAPSAPPTPVESGIAPPIPPDLIERTTPLATARVGMPTEVEVAGRPPGSAWKAALVGLVSFSVLQVIRRRLARSGPLAAPAPGGREDRAEPRRWPFGSRLRAGRKAGRPVTPK